MRLNNKVVQRALRRLAKQRPMKDKPQFLQDSTSHDITSGLNNTTLGVTADGLPNEQLISTFFSFIKIGDEVEVRDFGDDWGKGVVQAFDEDGDEKIPKVMQQGYDEAYVWDEYKPIEGWTSFIIKIQIEQELDAEEDEVDLDAEAEEEEAIFQLALCSLWTSQEKTKDFHSNSGSLSMRKEGHFNGQEVVSALSNERKRCRVLIAERDDATQSVARSEEAMQRLLKGASSMRSFFTSKVRDLENTKLSTSKSRGGQDCSSKQSHLNGQDEDNQSNKLKEAQLEIREREEESEQLAQELEEMLMKLNACYATISKLEHCGFKQKDKHPIETEKKNKNKIEEDEEDTSSKSSEEDQEEDLISAIDDLSVAMEEDMSKQSIVSTSEQGGKSSGDHNNDEQIAELTAEMERLRSELEASKAELQETKTEVYKELNL